MPPKEKAQVRAFAGLVALVGGAARCLVYDAWLACLPACARRRAAGRHAPPPLRVVPPLAPSAERAMRTSSCCWQYPLLAGSGRCGRLRFLLKSRYASHSSHASCIQYCPPLLHHGLSQPAEQPGSWLSLTESAEQNLPKVYIHTPSTLRELPSPRRPPLRPHNRDSPAAGHRRSSPAHQCPRDSPRRSAGAYAPAQPRTIVHMSRS
jgi:hypothetical protein